MGAVSGEDLHHARIESLLIRVEGVPRRKAFGAHCELSVLGDDAGLFLTVEWLLAMLVPALVEFAFEFIDPLFRGVVWGVGGSGSDVEQEGTSGRDAGGLPDPSDAFVSDIGSEVVVGIL